MSEKIIYSGSGLLLFVCKYFIPLFFIVFLLLVASDDFDNLLLSVSVVTSLMFVCVLWLIFNLLFLKKVIISEKKIYVKGIFKSFEYSFSEVSQIYQSYGFSPKMIRIVFKKKGFLNKFVITLPLPKASDILLMDPESVVTFVIKKINDS